MNRLHVKPKEDQNYNEFTVSPKQTNWRQGAR